MLNLNKALNNGVVNLFNLKSEGSYLLVLVFSDTEFVVPLIKGSRYRAYISPIYDEDTYSELKDFIEGPLVSLFGIKRFDAMYMESPAKGDDYTTIVSQVISTKCAKGPSTRLFPILVKLGYDYSALNKTLVVSKTRDYTALRESSEGKLVFDTISKVISFTNVKSVKDLTPEVRVQFNAIQQGKSNALFLIGPAGTGKTIQTYIMSQLMGAPLLTMQGDPGVPREQLLGKYVPDEAKGSGFTFLYSPLIKAIKYGYQMVIDEVNMLQADITCILNQILDDTPTITLDNGEVIEKHPNFVLYLTMNPGYEGTFALNTAFKSRAQVVEFPRLNLDTFLDRIESYSKRHFGVALNKDFYKKLFKFGEFIQATAKEFAESTEVCIRNAQQLCDSVLSTQCTEVEFTEAVHAAYTNNLNMDNDNSEKLEGLKKSPDFIARIKDLFHVYDYREIKEVDESSLPSFASSTTIGGDDDSSLKKTVSVDATAFFEDDELDFLESDSVELDALVDSATSKKTTSSEDEEVDEETE